MKWQEELLKQKHKRVLLRASRGAGKTTFALQWLKELEDVKCGYFVTKSRRAAESAYLMTVEAMKENIVFSGMVMGCLIVTFTNQKWIRFVSMQDFRGARAEAIVADEIGNWTSDEVANVLCNLKVGGAFVATYTRNLMSGPWLVEGMEGVKHIAIDYLDLLEDGDIGADDIRHIAGSMTPELFFKELGPFEKPKPLTNQDFVHLLSR